MSSSSRTHALKKKQTISWGILGTGNIAHIMAKSLRSIRDAEIVAVGSRDKKKTKEFGALYGIPRCYASYEELAADDAVDVVYIATPHPFHKDHALLALNAGKHVLCEKPFALNAAEARVMAHVARRRDLFLMEAMKTRFHPAIQRVKRFVKDGVIGDVKLLSADFGIPFRGSADSRMINPALGGGALLDLGVYSLSFASYLFGAPVSVTSEMNFAKTGVDETTAMTLSHKNGEIALLSCSIKATTPGQAILSGTMGYIIIDRPWHHSTGFSIHVNGTRPRAYRTPFKDDGYTEQALHVMECIRKGKTESPIMKLDESIEIMKTMDAIRAEWGFVYPTEKPAPSRRK